ncbi:MAG: hypothetical protein ACT4PL_06885 [Phycisphaerales bacterium]
MAQKYILPALVLMGLAGSAVAQVMDDQPMTLPFRKINHLDGTREIITRTYDNTTDPFPFASNQGNILGGGALNMVDDLNFSPGPWGSVVNGMPFAGPRGLTAIEFVAQFSNFTSTATFAGVNMSLDVVFDFYDGTQLDYNRPFLAGDPMQPGMLVGDRIGRATYLHRDELTDFIYSINFGVVAGAVAFNESSAAVRVRFIRPGEDPDVLANSMFFPARGQVAGFPPQGQNPVGQPQSTQIVFPAIMNNLSVGSSTLDLGRDNNLDGTFNGTLAASAAAGAIEKFRGPQTNTATGVIQHFAISLSGDAPNPLAPTPVTDLGTLACVEGGSDAPSDQIVAITNSIPDPPASGSLNWFSIRLPGPVSLAAQTFLDIRCTDPNFFNVDSAIGLYNVLGQVIAFDRDSGPGSDALLTFGAGRRGPDGDGNDKDGRNGDIAILDGADGDLLYLAVAAGTAGFGGSFNVSTLNTGLGSNGDVTLSFDHNLNSAGNCTLGDAAQPTILAGNDLGVLPRGDEAGSAHGIARTASVTAGNSSILWLKFTLDYNADDTDLTKWLDIDSIGSLSAADPVFAVFNEDGTLVSADDDSGPGLGAQLAFGGVGRPVFPAEGNGLPYSGQDGPIGMGSYFIAVALANVELDVTRFQIRSDSGSNLTVAVNFRTTPDPRGACTDANMVCTTVTEAACMNLGGSYAGNGTSCDCGRDFNNDGITEPGDLDEFITFFFSDIDVERDLCDFNNDGIVEPGDLDEFITAFFEGCP